MFVCRKYIVIIPVGLSIALLLSGCDNSKVAQCDRLMKAVSEGNTLIDKNKGQQVTTSLKLATDLEAVTKSLKQMNLQDPQLKKFQDKFVKVFNTLSQQITKAGKALGSAKIAQASQSGREKIQKARADIDTALTSAATTAKQSDALEAEVKKYCSASKE
jgi:transposase